MEKQLTAEELAELKSLNSKYGEIIGSLGEIDVNIYESEQKKKKLEEEKSQLLLDYMTVKYKTENLSKDLVDKYGSGKIDLSTGKIEMV